MELIGSNTFAKNIMQRYGIPTAHYQKLIQYQTAKAHIVAISSWLVIKISRIAAGKGIILFSTKDKAGEIFENIIFQGKFGFVGSSIVIKEYLEENEISVFIFSDGAYI